MQMLPSQFGRYTVRSVLAQTAMSTVYDAWDERIGRRVAVKTMSLIDRSDVEGQEALARFIRGAKAAGQLNHRNIVQVYDYAEQDDVVYLVMEFIEGSTLKAELDRGGAMDPSRIVRILDQVLEGLAYSHARGIVHRDIKPANILLTDRDEAKITDFGIARMERSDLTQPGMFIGTPSYMSPEQFRGDPIDFRTDLYSVGVILYQMLTARRPYEGGLATIMHKVLTVEPPAPSSFGGRALAVFDPVVQRAMAKRPQDRFASANDFAQAIRVATEVTEVRVTAAASRTPPAAPSQKRPVPGPPAPMLRPVHRPGGFAAWQLYALAGTLFVAAGVIGLVRSLPAHHARTAPALAVASLPEPPRPAAAPPPQAAHASSPAPPATSPSATSSSAATPPQGATSPQGATFPSAATPPAAESHPHHRAPARMEPAAASPSQATQRHKLERAAAAPPVAPPEDGYSLRRVLLRLSHEPEKAAPPATQAAPGPSSGDQAPPGQTTQTATTDPTLSVLWYAATSSPVGLLFQGNRPGNGPSHPRGLSVIGVLAGSPADQAGFRAGDLILAVDGQPVTNPAVFDRLRTGQFPGHAARLRILRDGKTETLPIALTAPATR